MILGIFRLDEQLLASDVMQKDKRTHASPNAFAMLQSTHMNCVAVVARCLCSSVNKHAMY
jgi:pyrimidine deaminase RibD-like protein